MLQRRWLALSLGLWLSAASAQAVSFSLDSIPAGPITSGNGQLEFSNFQFFSPFDSVDASEITLTVLEDGIELSGPVDVTAHEYKTFSVLYEVTALGAGIDGVSLLLDSSVDADDFALVVATKQILGEREQLPPAHFDWWTPGGFLHEDHGPLADPRGLARLETADWIFRHGQGHPPFPSEGAIRLVEAGFDEQSSIRVVDRVTLSARDGSAVWESSVNRFTVVPEPGVASLTLLGLTLLGWRARRRSD
jgi:hypothetical protein